jgi:hypothetical protein
LEKIRKAIDICEEQIAGEGYNSQLNNALGWEFYGFAKGILLGGFAREQDQKTQSIPKPATKSTQNKRNTKVNEAEIFKMFDQKKTLREIREHFNICKETLEKYQAKWAILKG